MQNTEGQEIISRLKELEYDSDNNMVIDIGNNPIRNKVLYIEKDIILKFIHDNEYNITNEIMTRLKKLIIVMIREHNNTNVSNIKLIRKIRSIAIGYRIQRNSSID